MGAIALQGPHQVANQSITTTGCFAMTSLNWSTLHQEMLLARWTDFPARFCLSVATHVSMLWTVILGNEEWKDLAALRRADVESGSDDREAVLKICFAMVVDIGNIDFRAGQKVAGAWWIGDGRFLYQDNHAAARDASSAADLSSEGTPCAYRASQHRSCPRPAHPTQPAGREVLGRGAQSCHEPMYLSGSTSSLICQADLSGVVLVLGGQNPALQHRSTILRNNDYATRLCLSHSRVFCRPLHESSIG